MQHGQIFMEWKRFLSGSAVEDTVPPMILDSWTRCVNAGVPAEPPSINLWRVSDDELTRRLHDNRELVEITRRHLGLISAILEPIKHAAYFVDRDGIVLESCGNVPDLSHDFGLLPGYDCSEHTIGTNGAGTALVAGRPVAVTGAEHFMRYLHDRASTAAPVHDGAGAIIGAIVVTTSATDAARDRLNIIAQLATMIEQESSSVASSNERIRRLQDRCARLEAGVTHCSWTAGAFKGHEPSCRELVDLLPTAVYVCDAGGVIIHYNRRAAQLWGREPRCGDPAERFSGATRLYLPDGSLLSHSRAPIAEVLRTGIPQQNHELIVERPDGSRIFVLANPIPIKDKDGHVTGALNCLLDITELKHAEETLRQSEARTRAILNHTLDAVIGMDEQGAVAYWNPRAEAIFGWTCHESVGRRLSELIIPPRYRERHQRGLRHFLDTGHGPFLNQRIETTALNRDGKEFPVELILTALRENGSYTFYAFIEDITDRKEAEDQLQQSIKQLRMLSRRIQEVKEEEQTRLAREIHDQLGVQMTILKLDLAGMSDVLSDPDVRTAATALHRKIDSMNTTLDQTIAIVQRVAADLRPRMLDDLDLLAAIEWEADRFKSRTGIHVHVITETDTPQLDSELTTALFRICQEALTNVARHAQATHVIIRIGETLGQILLEIEDDGRGIPAEKLTDRTSLGLLGMRERTELSGGEFHVTGNHDKGTIITVRMPTARAQHDAATQTL